MTDQFTIGELSQELGLTLRSIRFYEDAGLVKPARSGQARLYSRQDRARLLLICRGKRLGFSIAEIKEFLDLYEVDSCQRGQMEFLLERVHQRRDALKVQLKDVSQTLDELKDIEAAIVRHLNEMKQ